jgi:hypothetical protein
MRPCFCVATPWNASAAPGSSATPCAATWWPCSPGMPSSMPWTCSCRPQRTGPRETAADTVIVLENLTVRRCPHREDGGRDGRGAAHATALATVLRWKPIRCGPFPGCVRVWELRRLRRRAGRRGERGTGMSEARGRAERDRRMAGRVWRAISGRVAWGTGEVGRPMRGPAPGIVALPVSQVCLLSLTGRFEAARLGRGSWLGYFDQRHKEHTEREPKEQADSARDENGSHNLPPGLRG